ncbi:riboflavin synthase [Thermodesulfovibrionales bacterium]|nr:riboflavin synthase [Thermodesulfovibrionales bacterium]
MSSRSVSRSVSTRGGLFGEEPKMFTGLIIELAEVKAIEKRTDSAKLSIKSSNAVNDAVVGDSIAINGACLTVIGIDRNILSFDVSYETLKSTNLGDLKRGEKVNLEPSLRIDSKLGGHFVAGHIERIGRIKTKTPVSNAIRIEIEAPYDVLKYLVEKGSVAVDGVSLTVASVSKNTFSVVIIPHTAKITTIGSKNIGDTVNLEPDILAKYVAKFLLLNKDNDLPLLSTLKKSGFVS